MAFCNFFKSLSVHLNLRSPQINGSLQELVFFAFQVIWTFLWPSYTQRHWNTPIFMIWKWVYFNVSECKYFQMRYWPILYVELTYSNSYFFKVGKRPVFMQATSSHLSVLPSSGIPTPNKKLLWIISGHNIKAKY